MDWAVIDWLALGSWIGAIVAWGYPAWQSARTYRRDQDAREWQRFEHLISNLYNGKGAGYWRQIAAINEMCGMASKRDLTLQIFQSARTHWIKNGRDDDGRTHSIVEDLDRAISKLGG